MAKPKFVTKEQFENRFIVDVQKIGNEWHVSVNNKISGKLVYLGSHIDKEKALNEMYFQLNVVNYKSAK